MLIEIIEEDLKEKDPIASAIKRLYGLEASADLKFVTYVDEAGERHVRRHTLGLEMWLKQFHLGKPVKPISVEVN